MRKVTQDLPRGFKRGLPAQIAGCDFADGIALLSRIGEDSVNEIAKSVGMKIHPGKTKVMRAKNKSTRRICIGDTELEEVQHFKYLGSYISADSNIEKEISTRIDLASQAFDRLWNIWKSTSLQTKTKLRIYKSNVRSVLLYASETWRMNKKIE